MSNVTFDLVSSTLCPFVQRAAIALSEKRVAFSRWYVDLASKPDWFLTISPLGRVPLLQVTLASGRKAVLFESTAICEYVEESCDGQQLHPADAILKAQHRGWVEFASVLTADTWNLLTASTLEEVRSKSEKIREKLLRVENALESAPYFDGERFGMVDLAFAPFFRFFDGLCPTITAPIFEGLQRVINWRIALGERYSVKTAVDNRYKQQLHDYLKATKAAVIASPN